MSFYTVRYVNGYIKVSQETGVENVSQETGVENVSQETGVNLQILYREVPVKGSDQPVDIMTPDECACTMMVLFVGAIYLVKETADTLKQPSMSPEKILERIFQKQPEEKAKHDEVTKIVNKTFELAQQKHGQFIEIDSFKPFITKICSAYIKALNFWYLEHMTEKV